MAGLSCGVDVGTTNVKVVLADGEGRAVHTRSVPTPRSSDGVGEVCDPVRLLALVEAMIEEGWRAAGGGAPLKALATTGVGEDGFGLDARLRPTGPAIPWYDGRAEAEAAELAGSPAATPRTGIAIGPDRTAAKWLWTRRRRPGDLAAATTWVALTDWPAVAWTGRPFMSLSLAPRTACFDVHARRFVDPLLDAAGAPPLPPLLAAGAVVGTMAAGRLRACGAASADTLVVAGGHDHPVAAMPLRRMRSGTIVDSIGTANLLYGETDRADTLPTDPLVCFSLPPDGSPGLACLGVMEFAVAVRAAVPDAAAIELLAAARLPGGPPTRAGGAGDGDPALRLRRALEGAALRARDMLDAMRDCGMADGPIFATGGFARSTAHLELRASVLGRTVHAVDEPELAALSAAFLGMRAATGTLPRLDGTRRVIAVDPVPEWATAYAAAARRKTLPSPPESGHAS